MAEIKIYDKSLVIGNIYAPTKDEPASFDSLFSVFANFSHTDLMLAGDWNVVLNDTSDKDGGPPYVNRNSKEKIKSYKDFFNLRDVFRNFNPSKKMFTRIQTQPYTATRLDFFLVSDNLYRNFKSADISQSIMSGHKFAIFFLDIELTKRGSGYWKINNSILNDNDYIKMIKQVINDFLITNTREYTSPHILWETLKCVIRGETIKFCALRKKNQNRKQHLLESKLNTMESLLNNCPTKEKDNLISQINNTRNELIQFIQNDVKGAAVRSRVRWIEFGEKNSRYFLGSEKWHNGKKFIKSLKNTQENLMNDQKLILEELVNFYEKLYFETKTNNCELANHLFVPKINEKENMECEKPITESECFKVLSELSNKKSPGQDGFSIEFYKMFWQDLKEIFLKCLNYSLVANQLCDSQYEGVR